MIYDVNDSNLYEHVTKHEKIIWFLYRKGQENNLTIKPYIDDEENLIKEISEQFTGTTIFQSYISENPFIVEYFGLNDEQIWDYKSKIYNPRIISVVDGQIVYDQSGKKCYCLETILEMIFDLHPELIPVPPSE